MSLQNASHLILKMSMNEAFIWLSGHRFIDREIFNVRKVWTLTLPMLLQMPLPMHTW